MVGDGCSWWKRWFHIIRPWQKTNVDNDPLIWVRLHGVPCQAWCVDLFSSVAKKLGSFVCVDNNTLAGNQMDIARILIRV